MADLDLNELERLEKAADILRNGRLSAGIAGNADLVAFDGNDVTGIARFDNPARAAYVAALCNALSELLRRLRAAESECAIRNDEVSGLQGKLSEARARIAELRAEVRAHEAVRDACFEVLPDCAWGDVPGLIAEHKKLLSLIGDKIDAIHTLLPAAVEEQNRKQARIAELEAALQSIVNNSCCQPCREAGLVARATLAKRKL